MAPGSLGRSMTSDSLHFRFDEVKHLPSGRRGKKKERDKRGGGWNENEDGQGRKETGREEEEGWEKESGHEDQSDVGT